MLSAILICFNDSGIWYQAYSRVDGLGDMIRQLLNMNLPPPVPNPESDGNCSLLGTSYSPVTA